MRLSIAHTTVYRYENPVSYGLQELRLTPISRASQKVEDWQIEVEGGKVELEFTDQHRNKVQLISFSGDGHEIRVTSSGTVETFDTAGVTGKHTGFAPLWLYEAATDLTRAGNLTRKLTKGLLTEIDDPIARLHALSDRVGEAVRYDKGHTDVATSAEEVLQHGHGVCQDQAHVFIAAARAMGVPARYVSGYLLMADRIDQDATHAWAEAHVDGIGWIGFDIANEVCPDERYVRVATGLDYRQAAPVHGLRMGETGAEALSVAVQIQQQ